MNNQTPAEIAKFQYPNDLSTWLNIREKKLRSAQSQKFGVSVFVYLAVFQPDVFYGCLQIARFEYKLLVIYIHRIQFVYKARNHFYFSNV